MVDLSTVGSRMEEEVADGLLAKGIETVDAPVSGGAAGATKGTLAIMAAGTPVALEEVRGLFEVLGKVSWSATRRVEGQLLKLLNNMLSSTAFAITSEAFVAGVRGGLDPDVMMSVINAGGGKNGATLDKISEEARAAALVRFRLSGDQRVQGHRPCCRRMSRRSVLPMSGRQRCARGLELRTSPHAGRQRA